MSCLEAMDCWTGRADVLEMLTHVAIACQPTIHISPLKRGGM